MTDPKIFKYSVVLRGHVSYLTKYCTFIKCGKLVKKVLISKIYQCAFKTNNKNDKIPNYVKICTKKLI